MRAFLSLFQQDQPRINSKSCQRSCEPQEGQCGDPTVALFEGLGVGLLMPEAALEAAEDLQDEVEECTLSLRSQDEAEPFHSMHLDEQDPVEDTLLPVELQGGWQVPEDPACKVVGKQVVSINREGSLLKPLSRSWFAQQTWEMLNQILLQSTTGSRPMASSH